MYTPLLSPLTNWIRIISGPAVVLLFGLLAGCSSSGPAIDPEQPDFGEEGDSSPASAFIQDDRINEASGLVASRQHKGVLWVHNDSGDSPRVFAINEAGRTLGVYTVPEAEARDWEDMAIGPDSSGSGYYLYLADIGDNNRVYEDVVIYKIREPSVDSSQSQKTADVPLESKYVFTYPDRQHNSETFWVDPLDNMLYLMTKDGRTETVFRGSLEAAGDSPAMLEEQVQFTFPKPSLIAEEATGGDISPDGLKLLIKSYGSVYSWTRTSGSVSFFDHQPANLPYIPEPQGEAIAWSANGKGYFTLSEERNNVEAVLYYYPYLPEED